MSSIKTYPTAKFVMLHDTKAIKRNQLKSLLCVFLLLSAALVIALVSYFCYALIPLQSKKSFSSESSNDMLNITPIFMKKKLSVLNQKTAHLLMCTESQKLSVISLSDIFIQNLQCHLSVFDFLNLNLILYYERIIDKYDTDILKLIFSNYQNQLKLVKTSENFILFLKSLEVVQIKYYLIYLEKLEYSLQLSHFKYFLNLTEDLTSWYQFLSNLQEFLLEYKQQKEVEKYYRNITEKNFIEYIKSTPIKFTDLNFLFNITYNKVKEINHIVTGWVKPFEVKVDGSLVVIHGRVLLLSEVEKSLNALSTVCVKNVVIAASHTIYFDKDLVLSNTNVAIISPRWVFWKVITIDVSGRPGREHETKTALGEQDGKPGNPGENSGSFLGIGDINKIFLRVLANGGKGGNGQNGAKGKDGIDNTRPDPPVKKPTCVFKIGTFQNRHQNIIHYKIFNDRGCGSGGFNGGVGGSGGKGGEIILIGKNPKIIRGYDGKNGVSGKGGLGGAGGRNGCFYEAFDVNDEILHPVTFVKCVYNNTLPSGIRGKDNHNTTEVVVHASYNDLPVADSLLQFFSFVGEDFLEVNDQKTVSFFLNLVSTSLLQNKTDFSYVFRAYVIFEKLNTMKYFQFLSEDVKKRLETCNHCDCLKLSHLKTIVLGKMLILKPNVNFIFIDFDDYLSSIEENLRKTNMNYHVSLLNKKIEKKIKEIIARIKTIKSKLKTGNKTLSNSLKQKLQKTNSSKTEFHKTLTLVFFEEKILNLMLIVVDVLDCFLNFIQNRFSSENNYNKFNYCKSSSLNMTESKSGNFFENNTNLFSIQKEILLSIVMSSNEYEKFEEVLTKASSLIFSSIDKIETFLQFRKSSSVKSMESGDAVKGIKHAFDFLNEFDALSLESKSLIEALTDELDHFMALYKFVEWQNLEKLFLKHLESLHWGHECDELEVLEKRLREVLIGLQYKLAVDAAQQKFYPIINFKNQLQFVSDYNDALIKINHIRSLRDESFICNDIQEGTFDEKSSLGPFYVWPNLEIRNKLRNLFNGKPITLKSTLNNKHVLDKSFLKFRTIRLEFECRQNSILYSFLKNFQIEITHSGYSFYAWKGEVQVVVSDEVTITYSLKTLDNGEPELYNALFKKFKKTGPLLSPYTTWTIQLLPINEEADLGKLSDFVNSVNLKLTGEGTFVSL